MNTRRIGITAIILLAFILSSCVTAARPQGSVTPLWEAGPIRNKIVVCSDLHVGVDDAYAETVENRRYLVDFFDRIAVTTDVRELVINGDFLDEWYLPLSYIETDRAAFYRANIDNNQEVMDALKRVMAAGITLVYVVGNHDMSVDQKMVETALDGIIVPSDRLGLGLYRTGDRNEIVIEHGHRYDVYSAPDTITNAAITTGDTMFPPGYFYARYAADWVIGGKPSFPPDIPIITEVPDKTKNLDQYFAYTYYRILATEFGRLTLGNAFGDKIFDIRVDGYNGTYSVEDMFPVINAQGEITAPLLFPHYQRSWDERQKANGVRVPANFGEATLGALGGTYYEAQARLQFGVDDLDGDTDVVVFGHTHIPDFHEYGDGHYYVNSGTWIDHNVNFKEEDGSYLARTFVVITTVERDEVEMYQYRSDGTLRDVRALVRAGRL